MADKFKYHEYAGYRCLCSTQKQTTDLYLTYCGMEQCTPTHFYGPVKRSEYHIHFILDGEGYLEIEQQKYHLSKGQIFLLPANKTVYYYADHAHPWYYAWAAFNGDKAEYYLERAGFSSDCIIRDCIFPPEKYAAIINKMLLANNLSPQNEFVRIGCLFRLFSLLVRSNEQRPLPASTLDSYISHALQYMEYNYSNDISIASVADYVEMNRTYFSNMFKKTMNISPKNYLTKLRMEKACEFLSDTDESISIIAQKVGYSDQFAFSKMFRKLIQETPSNYRRNTSTPKKE